MSIATVQVLDAMYFRVGEKLNGKTLLAAQFVHSGEVTMDAARAAAEAANGYCKLLEIDGQPASQGGCCSS